MNRDTCICAKGYYGFNCQYFNSSKILNEMQSVQLFNLVDKNSSWSLIYQASTDGFSSKIFHKKCNGILGTLVVIRAGLNEIFGGYTEADWSDNYQFKYDSNAFLFSLVNSHNLIVKMSIINPDYAIYTADNHGPTFGNGDLTTRTVSGVNAVDCSIGYSNLGSTYQLPSFLVYGTTSAQSFLAGSYEFFPIDIEVYMRNF